VYSCWQVPQHLQQQHWTAVLTGQAEQLSERQLVMPDEQTSQILRVLSKFESSDFIHCFMKGHCPGQLLKGTAARSKGKQSVLAAAGQAAVGMVWHLPRCGLQFELSADGNVVSLDHRGYSLSTQQLLVSQPGKEVRYTLPEFYQYLVLQAQQGGSSELFRADRSEQLVLVPSGRVAVQRQVPGSTQQGASIHVQLGTGCAETIKVRLALQQCHDMAPDSCDMHASTLPDLMVHAVNMCTVCASTSSQCACIPSALCASDMQWRNSHTVVMRIMCQHQLTVCMRYSALYVLLTCMADFLACVCTTWI
jgi:hypothetical protein